METQEYITIVLYPVISALRKDTIRHRKTFVNEFGPQVTALEVQEDEIQQYSLSQGVKARYLARLKTSEP